MAAKPFPCIGGQTAISLKQKLLGVRKHPTLCGSSDQTAFGNSGFGGVGDERENDFRRRENPRRDRQGRGAVRGMVATRDPKRDMSALPNKGGAQEVHSRAQHGSPRSGLRAATTRTRRGYLGELA